VLNTPDLRQRVREDYELQPAEKEITFTLSKADERARVYVEIGGLMQRLLAHPLFELGQARVPGEGAVPAKRLHAGEFSDSDIVAVGGTVPKGVVKLRSNARSTSGFAAIAPAISSHQGGDD
jgi:hypothetical protein